jgi:hypothetical protein
LYILGQDPRGFLGRAVNDSIHPDDLSKLKNAIKEILNNKESAVVEMRKQHNQGHWIVSFRQKRAYLIAITYEAYRYHILEQ